MIRPPLTGLLAALLLTSLSGCATYYQPRYGHDGVYFDQPVAARASSVVYVDPWIYPFWSIDHFYFSRHYQPYSVVHHRYSPWYRPHPGWLGVYPWAPYSRAHFSASWSYPIDAPSRHRGPAHGNTGPAHRGDRRQQPGDRRRDGQRDPIHAGGPPPARAERIGSRRPVDRGAHTVIPRADQSGARGGPRQRQAGPGRHSGAGPDRRGGQRPPHHQQREAGAARASGPPAARPSPPPARQSPPPSRQHDGDWRPPGH